MFDVAVGLLVLTTAGFGVRRGLVMGLLDLAGWVAALLVVATASEWLTGLVAGATHWPRGIVDLGALLALLVGTLGAVSLGASVLYRRVLEPHIGGLSARVDHVLGLLPGAANGAMLAGMAIAFLLSTSVSRSINQSVLGSQLARPLATLALQVGDPFEQAVQAAALDVNGYLTRRFGETATRLTLPVTDMATDPAAEMEMLDLVNGERIKRGLVPLVVDARLTQVARQHSQEMLQMHYFAHDSPMAGTPFDRMARAGIRYRVAGENLALAPTVERAHTGLMNSPEHRDNILRPEFRKIGIGAISGGLSGLMFTQDFTD